MTRGGTLARAVGRKGMIVVIWLAAFGLVLELGKTTGLSSSDRSITERPGPSDAREAVHGEP